MTEKRKLLLTIHKLERALYQIGINGDYITSPTKLEYMVKGKVPSNPLDNPTLEFLIKRLEQNIESISQLPKDPKRVEIVKSFRKI